MAMKLYVKDEADGAYRSARQIEILAAMSDSTDKTMLLAGEVVQFLIRHDRREDLPPQRRIA